MNVRPIDFLTSESLARRLDLPSAVVREAVHDGTIQPDGTARAGRRLLCLFKPDRAERIAIALRQPKLATN